MSARDAGDASLDDWLAALGAAAREEGAEADAPLPGSGPLRPLDEGEKSAILAAVLAQRAGALPDDAVGHAAGPGPSTPLADVAAPSPPRMRRWLAPTLALVAAALLALFALRPGPTLPPYAVETTAGAQTVRGDTPTAEPMPVYTPGTRFRIVLRPATAPSAPVRATAALRGPDGPVDWQPPVQVGAGGSVKIEGVFAGPLALPAGDYTATFTMQLGDTARRTVEHRFRIAAP